MTEQQNLEMDGAAIIGFFISAAIGLILSTWLPTVACLGISILVWIVHLYFVAWAITKESE